MNLFGWMFRESPAQQDPQKTADEVYRIAGLAIATLTEKYERLLADFHVVADLLTSVVQQSGGQVEISVPQQQAGRELDLSFEKTPEGAVILKTLPLPAGGHCGGGQCGGCGGEACS
jgi:hypothetical protein